MNLYTHKDSNIRKTLLMFTIFLIVVIGIGWIFAQVYADPEILYIAVGFSVLMNVIAYWTSDKIALAFARAHPIKKEDNPYLYAMVENLCITAGLPMPKIYVTPERQINAFATGRDPQHAVIAVTQGALERLENEELEGVLAHELSHVGNRDILVSTVAVVLVGVISILSDFFMRMMWFGGMRSRDDNRGGGILALLGIIAAIVAPLAALLIQLAISRSRESLADASGALLTRYPEGLANALEKIAADTAPMAVARDSTAHLWIANPFKGKSFSWLHKLFLTHPPIEERIQTLRGMKA